MAVSKAIAFLLYSLVGYSHVLSMEEPVITRDIYDLLHYPNCDGKSAEEFDCGDTNAERFGDRRICKCRCKDGYLAYRDPTVNFDSKTEEYRFENGTGQCVWFGLYREGCHYLHVDKTLMLKEIFSPVPVPTILDLTASGSVHLKKQDEFQHQQPLCVDAYVRIPGTKVWTKVNDIRFELEKSNQEKTRYELSWSLTKSVNIYAYQGLVMKLNFSECFQSTVFCMIAKVAGTYAGDDNCKQRATNGRCCIFPFVYKDQIHNTCITSPDMPGGMWCAVGLNKSVDEGNHKWREFCSTSLTTTATRPLSRHPPTIHPGPVRPKTKTTPKQMKTEPQRFKTNKMKSPHIGAITVTVTHTTCGEGSKVPPNFGARETSEGSGDAGLIVGIVLGILVFLVVVALIGYYLRRRKTTRGKKTMSKDNLADSHYASIYSAGTPSNTLHRLNHGYQQSIELTEDQAAVVRRSYLRDSLKTGGSHFYDTVGSRPDTGLSCPIYSMPEADYSLIMEQRQTKIDNALPPVLPVMLSGARNRTNHLYSVLERENDPLQRPEPIDNDTVFVEANPLYSSTTEYKMHKTKTGNESRFAEANPLYGTTTSFKRKVPPPLPPRLYEDQSKGMLESKTKPEPAAKPGDKDV